MQDNHAEVKYHRMTTANLVRIQNARVTRGKTGWSKFVLRALQHKNGNIHGKWTLPHIPPRSFSEWQLEQAKKRAKDRESLVAALQKFGYAPEFIAAITNAVLA